jgi:hypothetical protein
MTFQGKNHARYKIVINNKIIEQVSNFNYLGYIEYFEVQMKI